MFLKIPLDTAPSICYNLAMHKDPLTPSQIRFKKFLLDKGIKSNRRFADSVGIDETLFSMVFNGHRKFPEKHLVAAADVLGENVDFARALLIFE